MTSVRSGYCFAVEFFRSDARGTLEKIGSCPADMDWQPALECARFEWIRKHRNEPPVIDTSGGSIVPSWDPAMGRPYIDGVYIRFDDEPELGNVVQDGPGLGMLIPTEIFRPKAVQYSSQLVDQGKLAKGETFRYRVCAYALTGAPQRTASSKPDLSVEPIFEPIRLVNRDLADSMRCASHYGPEMGDELPVIIPRRVLQEATRLTEGAGAAETGGVLLGHIHEDPNTTELFLRVTAQVPARRAEQALTKLTFTPQVWSDVDAALRLRNEDEIYLGWWHSHPARQWCKDCPVENRKRCKLSGEFFSSDDAALHQCVFPHAYSIALVISDSYAHGLTWPLFGWSRGIVAQRGYLIDEGASAARSTATTVVTH